MCTHQQCWNAFTRDSSEKKDKFVAWLCRHTGYFSRDCTVSVTCTFSGRREREGGYVPHVFFYVKIVFNVVKWASLEFSFARFIWLYSRASVNGFPIITGYISMCKHTKVGSLQSKMQQPLAFLMSQCNNPRGSVLLWMKTKWQKSILSFKC